MDTKSEKLTFILPTPSTNIITIVSNITEIVTVVVTITIIQQKNEKICFVYITGKIFFAIINVDHTAVINQLFLLGHKLVSSFPFYAFGLNRKKKCKNEKCKNDFDCGR